MEKRAPFVENKVFHVFNRGNGYEPIFRTFGNYDYFLRKYYEYMTPYWETMAYCLMPSHFHLMVRIKPLSIAEPGSIHPCVKAYADFCNGYVQAFNKQHGRMGSLFMRNFKRKMITDETYLRKLVCYIHNNPVKDGFVKNAQDWYHSSYHGFIEIGESECSKNEIIRLFGSKADFVHAHIAELSPGSIDIKSITASDSPRIEFLYERMKPGYPDDQLDWEVNGETA